MPTFPPVFAASATPKVRESSSVLASLWNQLGKLNHIPPVIYFGTFNPDRTIVSANYAANEVVFSENQATPSSPDALWWMIMLPTIDRINVGDHINFWTSRKRRLYGNVISVDLVSQTIVVESADVNPTRKTINISQVFAIVNNSR